MPSKGSSLYPLPEQLQPPEETRKRERLETGRKERGGGETREEKGKTEGRRKEGRREGGNEERG